MDVLKVEPELCRQTFLMSCDGNQSVRMKDEELPDVKVEKTAESVTLPVAKYENEVSFVGVCAHSLPHFTEVQFPVAFHVSTYLST
jgi:hypothetical protein